MQDTAYRDFHSRLVPTLNKDKIIGVRVPLLRKLAKELSKQELAVEFIKILPHRYYEEDNLHAFIIENINDYDRCVTEIDRFLPFVDNWATCDGLRPKCFRGNKERLLPKALNWIEDDRVYVKRFGIGVLMNHFLDEHFDKHYLEIVSTIRSGEYYVNMMVAWFFATALAKQFDSAVVFLEQHRLDVWTHNKTIQKAIESYRITQEQKAYLKTLKQ